MKLTLDLTAEQEAALTAYLRDDVPTIAEMVTKDYVERVEQAYRERLVAEAKAKVASFTDESKQIVETFEKQKEDQLLAIIAAEEVKQPPKDVISVDAAVL